MTFKLPRWQLKPRRPTATGFRKQALVLLGLLLFLLSACSEDSPPAGAAPTGKLAEVLRRGVLIIATEADYPPQSRLLADAPRAENTRCAANQYTANQLTGSDIEVAVEIARRLGVEPCFVTPPWSQMVSGAWNDRLGHRCGFDGDDPRPHAGVVLHAPLYQRRRPPLHP